MRTYRCVQGWTPAVTLSQSAMVTVYAGKSHGGAAQNGGTASLRETVGAEPSGIKAGQLFTVAATTVAAPTGKFGSLESWISKLRKKLLGLFGSGKKIIWLYRNVRRFKLISM